MARIHINKWFALLGLATLISSCEKRERGYLSDHIYYQVDPFEVQQGVTTVSASLILNGSTAPLNVKLLSIRDSLGNNADSVLLKTYSIKTFTSPITNNDTTLAQLNAKINDSMVRPFNVAPIGGRLQFTAATAFVPSGNYNFDLQVSNVNGTTTLKDACKIILKPLDNPYSLGYTTYRENDITGETQLTRYDDDPTKLYVNATYQSSAENKLIVKFVDKNGKAFSPKSGEVSDWSNESKATTYFPKLSYWAPYYPAEYTDTAIIQQLPSVNISFPYFDLNGSNAASDGARFDSKIKNLKSNRVLHTALVFSLSATGIYTLTFHLPQDEHK